MLLENIDELIHGRPENRNARNEQKHELEYFSKYSAGVLYLGKPVTFHAVCTLAYVYSEATCTLGRSYARPR